MNYIYGYQNKKNGKWYIGQTTMSIQERHRLHISGAFHEKASDYNCLFHKKIREYGIDNFDLMVLEEVSDIAKLDEKEQYWIKKKNSFVKDNGYNLTTGGQQRRANDDYIDARASFQTDKEIKQVISEIKDESNSLASLAKKYNVSLSLLCMINVGRKYHQIAEDYPLRPIRIKIDDSLVLEIINLLKENWSNTEIANLFNIDTDIVYRINYGRAHKISGQTYPIRRELSKNELRANRIKKLLQESSLNNKQIANLVGCDPSVVSNINYGKNYHDDNLTYPLRKN